MAGLDQETRKQREAMIVDRYGGIYPAYEAFYIHSIIYAAERSEAAFRRFDETASKAKSPGLVVATIQEALTHAGALSRFFWPVTRDNQLVRARGGRLREAFALDDTSPLKQRRLRNSFEHFDEHLDRFLLEDVRGYIFPSPMVDDHDLTDDAIGHIFKLVDPKHEICVLLGKRFEFRSIRQEVKRVLAKALQMDNLGARF